MEMRAGDLTDKLTLMKRVVSLNDYGAQVTSYENRGTMRASVDHRGGTVSLSGSGEVVATDSVVAFVRYNHQVAELDRVEWNDALYYVDSVVRNRKQSSKKLTLKKVNL